MTIPKREDIAQKSIEATPAAIPSQIRTAPTTPALPSETKKLTWKNPVINKAMSRVSMSQYLLRLCDTDTEVANFVNTAVTCFVMSTLVRPKPLYTWLDFPVPTELIESLGTKTISIDGSDKRGVIHINR